MAGPLEHRVLDRLARAGQDGVSMGAVVDEFVAEGIDAHAVERAIWTLLASGRLVLSGFVARKVRHPDARGRRSIRHTYEPLLARLPDDDA